MNMLADDHLDVLFVGDDAELAEIYRMKLELDGYLVRAVNRDEDWPDPSWRPDIAYVDVQRGEGIGARAHRRLRSDPALQGVPAVILSSLQPDELVRHGFVLGPLDYLVTVPEPFHLGAAVDRLSQARPVMPVAAEPN